MMLVDPLPFAQLEAGFALSPIPVWLFDLDAMRICWANPAALELWAAPSEQALKDRDVMTGAPQKVLLRLQQTITAIRAGQVLREEWAFYPQGKPIMVLLHLRAVTLRDGRLAMLNQALPVSNEAPPSLLRGITALRHTSLIIAYVAPDGQIRMQNPAALQTFADENSWLSWLADPAPGRQILARALLPELVQLELAVQTRSGLRVHAIDAHTLRDPVTGEPGVLIQQTDVTARVEAERTAAERLQALQAQHQEILLLSAPILEVGYQTIAIPIIGPLNEERCEHLTQRLLQALVARRASRAILDLTGVVEIESAGVARLRNMLAAIRLLGATPVLTGIRAEVAQQLTRYGDPLSSLPTLRSLADALSQLTPSRG